MAKWSYSVVTLFGILMIGASLALETLYIKNNQNTEDYFPHQVASVVMDTLVVSYLMGMLIYYRPYNSAVETSVAVILLMVGLGVEIFSTQWTLSNTTTWLNYLLTGVNSLIRLLILIQIRCDVPRTTITFSDVVGQIGKVSKEASRPITEAVRSSSEPLATIDPGNVYGKIASLLGPELSGLAPEKVASIKNAIKRGVGLEPKGGRR